MTAARIGELRRWLASAPPLQDRQPFLLLTPLARLDRVVALTLRAHQVRPREVRRVADYPRTSSALYSRSPLSDERARVQLAYEDAWRARVSDVSAELWLLDDGAFEAAWRIKPRLRREWPPEVRPFGARQLLLRTFHLPDPDAVEREWAWLAGDAGAEAGLPT